ncbi:hypothetical protein BZA77DRAFT_352547 [Pyronema omphalodes]|nr:hypothetical protein BZA77DRAFT_352547 [Pyronema omphalodes]
MPEGLYVRGKYLPEGSHIKENACQRELLSVGIVVNQKHWELTIDKPAPLQVDTIYTLPLEPMPFTTMISTTKIDTAEWIQAQEKDRDDGGKSEKSTIQS